ncbi:anti-sigma factor antagonist [Steroidobacter agaridevorans]|nr:anti-sigma factor antagonist [Steroidobacter agaridevorans]
MEPKDYTMDLDQKLSMGELRVDGEMTIYRANEVAQTLFASVRAHAGDVKLDLSDVSEFDTAGLQLVLMARRIVEANGHRLDLVRPSQCVAEVLDLCNVALTTDPTQAAA